MRSSRVLLSALLASSLLCCAGQRSGPSPTEPRERPAGARARLKPLLARSLLARAMRGSATGRAICDQVREALIPLRRDPGTFVRHSPAPPARRLGTAMHHISARGALLPLPPRAYDVSLTYRSDGFFEVSLFTGARAQPSLLLLGVVDTSPMQDVFALVADRDPPSPERVAYTRRLFGKAPDLLDLLSLGLRVTPDTLRCDPTTVDPALRDLVVLALKVASPGEQRRAHLELGVPGSVLELGEDPGRTTIRYLFRHAGRVFTYDCSLADRTLADELEEGFLQLASPTRPTAPLPPELARVFSFVERPTRAVARTLLDEARRRSGSRGAAQTIASLERYLATP